MPNFDAGHYFLTTFAPIRRANLDADRNDSPVQRVRAAVDRIPRARQSAMMDAFSPLPRQSPFAGSLRTHLCRFVVIDDVIYNGREPADAILMDRGLRPKPLDTVEVDHLPSAYLMFTADFDATRKPGERLPDRLSKADQDAVRDDYLREIWQLAKDDLAPIYRECEGFDPTGAATPEQFADYLAKCQVETCMPFNDYYTEMPTLPLLPVKALLAAVGVPAAIFLISLFAWLFGVATLFGLPTFPLALGAFGLAAGAGYGAYRYACAFGNRPWPAAEQGDLPSVLKALHVQQGFADFIAETAASAPADRRAAFGAFLDRYAPEDVLTKTQKPGVTGVDISR
jgi:hypothetical protein